MVLPLALLLSSSGSFSTVNPSSGVVVSSGVDGEGSGVGIPASEMISSVLLSPVSGFHAKFTLWPWSAIAPTGLGR